MEHVREDWAEQSRTAMLEEAQNGDSPENTQPAAQEESENAHQAAPPGVDADADNRLSAEEDGPRGRSSRSSSPSHLNPEPGFAHIDGDVGGSGYNETKVDIIAVSCPGADPVETWTRDPLPDGYFGLPTHPSIPRRTTVMELAGDAILSPGINRHLPPATHLWVRQGIRNSINTARVLMYRHRALTDTTTLDELAQDLLEQVSAIRQKLKPSRPLFFIAHSIGGLVVKLALLKASRLSVFHPIMYNCHGVGFFSTPHRGSSYMSMNNLKASIADLLHLQRPLPAPIAERLRLGDKWLQEQQDSFVDIASELRIWTFYETIDSQLSGSGGAGLTSEVQFGAPLVSIKSSILGVRQENVYSVDSDHAHCASFGEHNLNTMAAFLDDLAKAVRKAQELSLWVHTPLHLKDHVRVQLIGFYDDPDAGVDVRLYYTKSHLSEFLVKGPEKCLEERLKRMGRPAGRGPLRLNTSPERPSGRNLPQQLQGMLTHMPHIPFWNTGTRHSQTDDETDASPGIVVTGPSNVGSRPGPVAVSGPVHSLTVPGLATPGFRRPSSRHSDGTASTMSEPVSTLEHGSLDEHRAHSDDELPPLAGHDTRDFDSPSRRRTERTQRLSRNAAFQELSAGFSRPNPSLRKFIWIHLPFNNPLWVKDVFDVLSRTHHQNFSKLFNHENWVSRHIQGRHSLSQPSFIKPACNYVPADPTPSPRNSGSHSQSPNRPGPSYLYLYLPYLHFDTYRSMIRRRNIINRRLKHGRARPVPDNVAKLNSLELRVIWEYLGYDPPLNYRRTLDQFGYPSMKDTYARDDDQMLYKLTKHEPVQRVASIPGLEAQPRKNTKVSIHSPVGQGLPTYKEEIMGADDDSGIDEPDTDPEEDLKDGNVLMVDQLWLWAIDTTTLATFFPKRESSPLEGTMFRQGDLMGSIYSELNGDLTGRTDNALDLAAFITLHAITVLLDRTSHPDLEIFRIFEEAIGMLTERMTSNLKKFRMQTFRDISVDGESDDPEENSAASIKKRHKREMEKAERENRENTSALLELRDMEDELSTLNKLFETQETAVRSMKTIYESPELKGVTSNGRTYLDEALNRLDEYKLQTKEMLRRVDTTRQDFEKMLEMAQRQAQVDDVRWSRLQTELASSQNLSVMIFTTFTVIFLPLTFFTGLFGMNASDWQSEVPSLKFIGAISLPASLVLIACSLVGAFNLRVQGWVRSVAKQVKGMMLAFARLASKMQPEARRVAKKKRREEKEQADARQRSSRDRAYDFWAMVQKENAMAYQIPDLNKNRTIGGGGSSPAVTVVKRSERQASGCRNDTQVSRRGKW